MSDRSTESLAREAATEFAPWVCPLTAEEQMSVIRELTEAITQQKESYRDKHSKSHLARSKTIAASILHEWGTNIGLRDHGFEHLLFTLSTKDTFTHEDTASLAANALHCFFRIPDPQVYLPFLRTIVDTISRVQTKDTKSLQEFLKESEDAAAAGTKTNTQIAVNQSLEEEEATRVPPRTRLARKRVDRWNVEHDPDVQAEFGLGEGAI